jgi:hypothetical protein
VVGFFVGEPNIRNPKKLFDLSVGTKLDLGYVICAKFCCVFSLGVLSNIVWCVLC